MFGLAILFGLALGLTGVGGGFVIVPWLVLFSDERSDVARHRSNLSPAKPLKRHP